MWRQSPVVVRCLVYGVKERNGQQQMAVSCQQARKFADRPKWILSMLQYLCAHNGIEAIVAKG